MGDYRVVMLGLALAVVVDDIVFGAWYYWEANRVSVVEQVDKR